MNDITNRGRDTHQEPAAHWEQCPDGELSGMVGAMQSARVRKRVTLIASLTAVAMFVVTSAIVANILLNQPTELSHHAVAAMLPEYVQGKLSPAEAEAVENHLAKCPACRRHYEDLRDGITHAAPTPARRDFGELAFGHSP